MSDFGGMGMGLGVSAAEAESVAAGITANADGSFSFSPSGESGGTGYSGPAGWAEAMATNYGIANANGTVTGVPGGTVGSSAGFAKGPDAGYYGAPAYTGGRGGILGWVQDQVRDAMQNPVRSALDALVSFSPFGPPNILSNLLGGPTIGGGLTSLAQAMTRGGSQDADGDGVITVGDDFANYGMTDPYGWEGQLNSDIGSASVSSDEAINQLIGIKSQAQRDKEAAAAVGAGLAGTTKDGTALRPVFRIPQYRAPTGLDYYRYGIQGGENPFYQVDNQTRLS